MPPFIQEAIERSPILRGRFLPLLGRSLLAHNLFLAIIGLYVLAYAFLLGLHPQIDASEMLLGIAALLLFSVPFMLISLMLLRFYHIARYVKPVRPLAALGSDLKSFLTNPRRMANGVPMFLLFVAFGHVFVALKSDIYVLNGFKWDATLAHLDAMLHFGVQPWVWLQPLLGHPAITFLLNCVYNMWFFVMWMWWVHLGFAEESSELRTRFFLTFFLLWIVGGSLMAILYSSAGPAYYGRLVGGVDPFAGLMSYLHQANQLLPIWAVDLQEVLWQGHLERGMTAEISAMPSMHNGTSLLFALAAYRKSRFWGHVMMVNALLIFVGSIHLGWHYAVDGYLAWAICYVLWWACVPLASWWHKQRPQAELEAALAGAA